MFRDIPRSSSDLVWCYSTRYALGYSRETSSLNFRQDLPNLEATNPIVPKKIGRYRLPLHRYFIIPSSYHCLPSSSLYLSSLTAILLPYHCPLIACSLTCPPPGISAPTSIHLSIALPQNVPSSLQWRLLRNSRMPAASR